MKPVTKNDQPSSRATRALNSTVGCSEVQTTEILAWSLIGWMSASRRKSTCTQESPFASHWSVGAVVPVRTGQSSRSVRRLATTQVFLRPNQLRHKRVFSSCWLTLAQPLRNRLAMYLSLALPHQLPNYSHRSFLVGCQTKHMLAPIVARSALLTNR